MSNAHTEIPEADAYSADSLQACRPGDRGNAVAALQQRLKTLEYYDYSRITGYYGPVTREAVKRFQRVNGLAANGLADIETMTLLSSERGGPYPVPGRPRQQCAFLQQRLRRAGLS